MSNPNVAATAKPVKPFAVKTASSALRKHPEWYVFKLPKGQKAPPPTNMLNDGIRPPGATNDLAVVEKWGLWSPAVNIGIAPRASRLVFMDVDTKVGKVGAATFKALIEKHGPLPKTLTVRTPSGGLHYWFYETKEVQHNFRQNAFGPDVDCPQYVLVPGSHTVFIEGKQAEGFYTVVDQSPIAPAPAWFAEYLQQRVESPGIGDNDAPAVDLDDPDNIKRAIDFLTDNPPKSIEGRNGDIALLMVAGALKDLGISETKSAELIGELYNVDDVCVPVWTAEECRKKVRNAWEYLKQNRPGALGIKPDEDFGADPPDPLPPEEETLIKEKAERKRKAQFEVRAMPPVKRYTLPELCNEWVWLAPQKRFVNRLDPEFVLDKEAFNDLFQYLKGDAASLTRRLFGQTTDTIPKLKGAVYRPDASEFTADGFWNGWRPSPVIAVKGDTTLFHAHIAYLFPNEPDQKLLLDWLAAVLQNPATKPRHQLFIHGRIQRTGKTFFARLMRELLGRSNVQMLTQDILENGFTGWAMRTKLVWIEEVRDLTGSKKATSKLHSWASESTMTINQKNLPTFVMDQVIAFMIFSNKLDALALDNSDGRYLVLRTDVGTHPKGAPYYSAVYGDNGVGGILQTPALLSAILYELLNRPLDGYSIEQAAPSTKAKRDMIEEGYTAQHVWMKEHDGGAPMRYRVKAAEEIVEAMPNRLKTLGANKAVREALRDHFDCVPWEKQIRPDGRSGDKVRVWLTGDLAKRAVTGNLTSTQVLMAYREDRAKAKVEADNTAADDFAD
jgi:hypothetical protein